MVNCKKCGNKKIEETQLICEKCGKDNYKEERKAKQEEMKGFDTELEYLKYQETK